MSASINAMMYSITHKSIKTVIWLNQLAVLQAGPPWLNTSSITKRED